MIIVSCHIIHYKNGLPAHGTGMQIAEYLEELGEEYVFFKHPLFAGSKSRIESYAKKKRTVYYRGYDFLPMVGRIIQDFIITIWEVSKMKRPVSTFIGIDPINGTIGIFLKKIGWTKHTIFYSADYATNRFPQYSLNFLYQHIDHFAATKSDEVWSVSSRIHSLRITQGIEKKRNFILPNAPLTVKKSLLPERQVHKHDLVIVSRLSFEYINFREIFVSLKTLRTEFPTIHFHVIGSGDDENDIRELAKKMGIRDAVVFHGSLPHDQVMQVIERCSIGIALYVNDAPWARFGDSMKIREYLSVGVPVITTEIPSTADDIKGKGIGFIIKSNREITKIIRGIFKDKKKWNRMRESALQFSRENSSKRLLDIRLKPRLEHNL